jgi:hypothetical protein
VLRDIIEHHVEEEETQMFPKARKVIGNEELRALGQRIQMRRQALQSGLLTRAARTVGSAAGTVVSRVGSRNGRKKRAA